jgi:hypothetical protein
MEDAIKMASEIAGSVKGYDVECMTHSLDEAQENIDKAKEFGVWPKEGKE